MDITNICYKPVWLQIAYYGMYKKKAKTQKLLTDQKIKYALD